MPVSQYQNSEHDEQTTTNNKHSARNKSENTLWGKYF